MTTNNFTLGQIFTDQKFEEILLEIIDRYEKDRTDFIIEARKQSKHPIKLKRTAFDSLQDQGIMDPKKLVVEYLLIVDKRSRQSSRDRFYISKLISEAISATLTYHASKEKEQGTPALPEKKKRVSKKTATIKTHES
jgi:hypothetical protein